MIRQERIQYLIEVLELNLIETYGSTEDFGKTLYGNYEDPDIQIETLIKCIYENISPNLNFMSYKNGFQCPICLGYNTYDNYNLAGCADCNVCITDNC